MKILYVGMKYDYGKPERGLSFEHCNFFDSLENLGHDVIYFDFMSLIARHGRERMNRLLLATVRSERPDLLFAILFDNEFEPSVMREISECSDTVTANWFCDDHWRFESFSKRWAPCFNWIVTTAESALPKYEAIGYGNVVKSQWACNHFSYRKLELPMVYDVTFVGQPHGGRREVIARLEEAGIGVGVWGTGWESGRLDQDKMIRVFNESRINLNLSNASTPVRPGQRFGADALGVFAMRSLGAVPGGWRIKRGLRQFAAAVQLNPKPPEASVHIVSEQIKGRNFEVPGCGGFLLTGRAENLADYYEPEKEVGYFESVPDLIEKIRHYLLHEDERAAIAEAGHTRTLAEHTYTHRFADLFARIGLLAGTPNAVPMEPRPSTVLEID